MLEFLSRFQAYAVPIAIYVLIFLAGVFVILLVIYLSSIYVHAREKRYVDRKTPLWRKIVEDLLKGERSPKENHLSPKGRRYLKEFLIGAFFDKEPSCTEEAEALAKQRAVFEHLRKDKSCLEKVDDIYRQLGFHKDDIRELKSVSWWRRAYALERLTELKVAEAEDQVFPLLRDKRSEVRFSALKMLASIQSRKLYQELPKIFAESTRWAYRYLVNILYVAGIPADSLLALATSESRDLRKAAAILLGRKGNVEALSILAKLENDDVKDVRREAVRSLSRIASAEALPILEKKAQDPHPQVRAAVAKGLGELKDPKALPVLSRLADDPEFEVRFQAFWALSRFEDEGRNVIRRYEKKYPEIAREFLLEGKYA